MTLKFLTLKDILVSHPIEVNGVLLDAETTFWFRQVDDGSIEIDAEEIGEIYVLFDLMSVPLQKGGASYSIICRKFEAEVRRLALKLAGEVAEYKWTVVQEDNV